MDAPSHQRELALALFNVGAIQFGAFKLKLHETQPNAPLSPIFLNLRTPDNPKPGPLTPEIMGLIGQTLAQEVKRVGISFSRVAGIPNAGDPFATALGASLGLGAEQFITFEKQTEPGGRKITRVNGGTYEKDDVLLLVDDLITQADTKLEAVKAAREAGLLSNRVLVLVDRQQGGKEQLEKGRVALFSAFTLSELLGFYVDEGCISNGTRKEVLEYIAVNRA